MGCSIHHLLCPNIQKRTQTINLSLLSYQKVLFTRVADFPLISSGHGDLPLFSSVHDDFPLFSSVPGDNCGRSVGSAHYLLHTYVTPAKCALLLKCQPGAVWCQLLYTGRVCLLRSKCQSLCITFSVGVQWTTLRSVVGLFAGDCRMFWTLWL